MSGQFNFFKKHHSKEKISFVRILRFVPAAVLLCLFLSDLLHVPVPQCQSSGHIFLCSSGASPCQWQYSLSFTNMFDPLLLLFQDMKKEPLLPALSVCNSLFCFSCCSRTLCSNEQIKRHRSDLIPCWVPMASHLYPNLVFFSIMPLFLGPLPTILTNSYLSLSEFLHSPFKYRHIQSEGLGIVLGY